MTAPSLTTKSARDRLPTRREPYWIKLESGKFLGFRVTPSGAFWVARCRVGGRQQFSALGSAASLALDDAKRLAEAWFQSAMGPPRPRTHPALPSAELSGGRRRGTGESPMVQRDLHGDL